MRIGIFTDSYIPRVSGVVRSVEAFTRSLRKRGHQVYVFAPAYPGHYDQDGDLFRFPSLRLPRYPDFPFAIPYSRRILGRIPQLGLEVAHAHSPFLMGQVALCVAKRLGIPLVFTHHTLYTEYLHYVPLISPRILRPVVLRYTTAYCNRCQCVIAPSQAVKTLLQAHGVTAPIEVVPTAGIEPEVFASADPTWVRQRFRIPWDRPVVITVSRLTKEKSVHLVIEAFREIHRVTGAFLLVVGGGPEERSLRDLARALGVSDAVVFTGALAHPLVIDCCMASDLFLFASQTETQGIVLVEAMAAGLPIVAVDAGGVRDAVVEGITGYLVPPDPRTLAEQAIQLLLDEERRRRMGGQARELAQSFAVDRLVEKLERIYFRLSRPLAISSSGKPEGLNQG
ncbi:MAG: glycosyltransferase family 4 protein [Armatimonadota bacterium]|nr:glycosyltransferase family 4 protein [Armatimonadota bacterium]MDR5703906.1 glycosyltransferase family 4 protein [Armatimonadota bacterium]MDR7435136.1 glycosyltransferase family 4 protein [Armatimonadota bacterium]